MNLTTMICDLYIKVIVISTFHFVVVFVFCYRIQELKTRWRFYNPLNVDVFITKNDGVK